MHGSWRELPFGILGTILDTVLAVLLELLVASFFFLLPPALRFLLFDLDDLSCVLFHQETEVTVVW